jgi:serine/threonine protein kinase/tetratricopeptide (TPR) repeat protein
MQVRTLLAQASELPADERKGFLDRACGGDGSVRAEVETLLAMLDQADGFLNPSRAGPLGPDQPPPAPESDEMPDPMSASAVYAPGTVIRQYTLLNLIGEGGFGRVYLAGQTRPVARQVALKIIKPGMDTRQVVSRFMAERQALALMDHPNIARVLDAGSTAEGRPFFVMELVRGMPVTEYCHSVNLPLRERLELFISVCRAVQHAHQKGIIHRDLKPGNVLVTMADGRPIPKVIDFGVAKAISPTGAMLTLTGERQWMGTPQYMSPEQAAGGGDIDTRSDIYSLGALLYELTTGAAPFDSARLRHATPFEIQRIVANVEPVRPSLRVMSAGEPGLAGNPLTKAEARKVSVELRGDLDWIVMRSLEKDRARRYATANGLADDVARYLRGEPVVAGPPSSAYRIRKLVGRNRALITASALVLAALLLGTIGTAVGMLRARDAMGVALRQRDAAARSEALARQETARAGALNAFLTQMLSSADPRHAKGRDLLVREVLEGASRQVEQSPPPDAHVAEAIHYTLGVTYQSLGLYRQAARHLEAAMKIRRDLYGERNLEVARCMATLADVLWDDDRYAAAEPLYRLSLQIRKDHLGEENVEVAAEMQRIANMLQGKGDWGEAEHMYLRSLEIRRKLLGENNLETARSMAGLALLRRDQGRKDEMTALIEPTLRIRRNLLPPDDPAIAEALFIRGGRDDLEEALSIQKRSLGPDHPEVAETEVWLAIYLIDKNELGSHTEELLTDAFRIQQKAYGREHGELAKTIRITGQLYAGRKDLTRARWYFSQSLEMYRKLLGEDAPEVGWVFRELIPVLEAREEYPNAEQMLLKRYRWSLDRPETRFSLEVAAMLADLYTRSNQPDNAAKWRSAAGNPTTSPTTLPARN